MSNRSYRSDRQTHTIDATDQVVGRLATRIAFLLMGKGKRLYAPYRDDGDYVVVTNVGRLRFTGRKLEQKEYKHFSGYPGGLKRVSWATLLEKNPQKLLRLAVLRMLPKNKLQAKMIARLKFE